MSGAVLWMMILIGLSACGASAGDDKLFVLNDGRYFVGRVIEDDGETLTIEIKQNGITGRATFKASEVVSVSDAAEAEPHIDVPPEPVKEKAPPPSETWGLVELRGRVGEDVFAVAIEKGIDRAVLLGLRDVVVDINLTGGAPWAAMDAARVLADRPESVRLHAIVANAPSCAAWLLAACDTRHFLEGATVGGGPELVGSGLEKAARTDTIERTQRELAAVAASGGIPDFVLRAWIANEAQVWTDAEDALSDKGPGTLIDGDGSILSLTGHEAVKFGLGSLVDERGDDAAVLESLGAKPGAAYDRRPSHAFAAANRPVERLLREAEEDVALLREQVARFKSRGNLESAEAIEDAVRRLDRTAKRREQARLQHRWPDGELDLLLYDAEAAVARIDELRAEKRKRK